MKAEDIAAARINLTMRHKKTGKVYRTILNSNGFSWMQVRMASSWSTPGSIAMAARTARSA
jgi:hypothetical protein